MSNIVPIRRCARCKEELGEPVDLAFKGEVFATVNACAKCVAQTAAEMAKSRPIFDAMIAAGVPRELANDAMTWLLERWTPDASGAAS
jgi:hypothetical protein